MLEDISRMATTVRNTGIRALWKEDAARLDAYMAEHGEMPKKASDVLASKLYSYPIMRAVAPRLSSHITATLQHNIDSNWRRWRFDVLIRQNRTAPHFRIGQPVPIPKSSVTFRVEGERGYVTASMYSEKHDGHRKFTLPIAARDDHQRAVLAHLASGEWRHGEVQIERDRLKPSKWYLKITYKRLVPRRTTEITAAINRGMKAFIVAVTSANDPPWIYDGDDIEAYLKQIQRRRKQYQYQVRASARVGHGRTRTIRPTEHLTGKAERWRKSRCQVIARRLANWLGDRGVSKVYLEDFSGIRDGLPEKLEGGQYVWQRIQEWPYYQLGMRLTSCLEELGITVETIDASFHSQRCPRCGHTCKENRDLKQWKLRCVSCKWSRHLDIAHCMNALASAEAKKKSG